METAILIVDSKLKMFKIANIFSVLDALDFQKCFIAEAKGSYVTFTQTSDGQLRANNGLQLCKNCHLHFLRESNNEITLEVFRNCFISDF